MKTVNKAKLDKLIDMVRDFAKGVGHESVEEQCDKIIEYSRKELPNYDLVRLANVNLSYGGLNPEATNEDIYKVLEVLGWEVEV